jgi:hypothetical protein
MPILDLKISNGSAQVEVGIDTNYEIQVVNSGRGAATGVKLLAQVPEGMLPLTASGPAPYHVLGRQVIFEPLARLNPMSQASYSIKVRCQRTGDWRFKAQLGADQLRQPLNKEEMILVYKDK